MATSVGCLWAEHFEHRHLGPMDYPKVIRGHPVRSQQVRKESANLCTGVITGLTVYVYTCTIQYIFYLVDFDGFPHPAVHTHHTL